MTTWTRQKDGSYTLRKWRVAKHPQHKRRWGLFYQDKLRAVYCAKWAAQFAARYEDWEKEQEWHENEQEHRRIE